MHDADRDARRRERQPLAATYVGTERSVSFIRFGEKGARPKVYLQAALHAGEMTGTLALHHLGRLLREAEAQGMMRGEVVLVPLANPIGLGQFLAGDHFGRFESLGLTNFNRDHLEISEAVAGRVSGRLTGTPEDNVALIRAEAISVLEAMDEPSEWLSLRKHLLLRSIDADLCLDLHSDMDAVMFMYINALDWPALAGLAADLGCKAVVELDPYVPSKTFAGVVGSLWPRLAERFPEAAIPLACRSAMIEMRGRHDCSDELASADARNLLNVLKRRGAIDGDPDPLPASQCASIHVEGMDVGYAPRGGFAVFRRKPGETVAPGDVICDVIDPTDPDPDRARIAVTARQHGVIYARALDGSVVVPGRVLFRIAGAQALAHRSGRSWLDD